MRRKVLKRKDPNNPQIKAYVEAVKKGERNYHVVPNGKGWIVKKPFSSRASGVFNTQREAIGFGKKQAKNQQAELFIHRKDGKIRERNSYGKDPFPPRG